MIHQDLNIETLFTHAQQSQLNEQWLEAIKTYEEILEKSPHDFNALYFIALAHAQQNHMSEAIAYFIRALKIQPTNERLHNNLGSAYKKSNDQNKAIYHYQQALNINPLYAQAHNNLATIYAMQNNVQQALHHYRSAIPSEPDFSAAHYNLGLLLLKKNQWDAAKKQFNNVITLHPQHQEAYFYLAVLQLETNELQEAEENFLNVLSMDNEHIDALINIGVIAVKKEQGQRAVDYFTKALALDNDNEDARNNLAAAFIHHDRFENALIHYNLLLQQAPKNMEYLYNAGVAEMTLGHLQEAKTHFETMLSLENTHFEALTNLAAIHNRLDDREQAIVYLKQALAARPEDDCVTFMLNAMTGEDNSSNACPAYVHNLFNSYALYYDQHVQGPLNYMLPELITRILQKQSITDVTNTIDLGCGTGLCGSALRNISHHLIGVDIADKMLSQARTKGFYDELIENDVVSYLENHQESHQLAVAADVLPYLSDLAPLFQILHKRLTNHGYFIFSHEIGESSSWTLQQSARFAHHPDYIQQLCADNGFQILYQENVVARLQNDQSMPVMLYLVINNHV
jgi:predicted TPR repeat methyltransferase